MPATRRSDQHLPSPPGDAHPPTSGDGPPPGTPEEGIGPARRTALAPTGAGGEDPRVEGAAFAAMVCDRYRDWVTSRVRPDVVPAGWRPMLTRTFAEIAEVVGPQHYVLRRLGVEMGSLAIALVPIRPVGDSPSPGHVQVMRLVGRARNDAQRLCQVCGAPGTLQFSRPYDTLCPTHARSRASAPRDAGPSAPTREPLQLYRPADVAAAIGGQADEAGPNGRDADTDHALYLRRILRRGEDASWRDVVGPTCGHVAALDGLDRRAPQFGEVTDLVRRHLKAAIAMGTPTTLPAIMLLGEPGFGKSWYVRNLGTALGLPVRDVSMNTTSMGDSLMGAYPVWRNARPGLVARTLLEERVANPVILVDEVDKPAAHGSEDPYRPFYTALEPEGAARMVDDYLGFAMNASRVSWLLAGNSVEGMPAPILDRLLVLTIPAMDDEQRRAVAASVYAEQNAARRRFFDPTLTDDVVDRLASLTARGMRRAIGEGMVRAAADGRRALRPDDVRGAPLPARRRIGFT